MQGRTWETLRQMQHGTQTRNTGLLGDTRSLNALDLSMAPEHLGTCLGHHAQQITFASAQPQALHTLLNCILFCHVCQCNVYQCTDNMKVTEGTAPWGP